MLRLSRLVRTLPLAAALAAALVARAAPAAADPADLVLHRVFLSDGTALVSYGEYARVGDRVVFSMPIDPDPARLRLQLVSVPDASVDWSRTEEYTETVRRNVYVATRAEADFAAMSVHMAGVLEEIRTAPDPAAALERARQARDTLLEWPRSNYGYRDAEVRQIASLLDEAISELQISSGGEAFDLSLVAMARRPPAVPLLRRPTLREAIEHALAVSRLTPEPAERLSLARAVVTLIDEQAVTASELSLNTLRAEALTTIAAEERIDRAYADVARLTLDLAAARAGEADVNGVEAVVKRVLWHDDRLGRQRPQVVAALLAAIEVKLDAARRLSREQEQWKARRVELEAYSRSIAGAQQQLARAAPVLRRIRERERPSEVDLARTIGAAEQALRELAALPVPDECRPLHALLASALQLAASASRLRRADRATDSQSVLDASSAAAGALMLAQRARDDVNRLLSAPGAGVPSR